MEEEIKEAPRKKRRVSLFKRRRRADIRPLVREKKKREFKKIIGAFVLFLAIITILSAVLYLVRYYVIEPFISKNTEIITPNPTHVIDNNQAREIIEKSSLMVSSVEFATDSAEIRVLIKKDTHLILTKDKDIAKQMELVEAIDRQLTMDGKRAVSIDLRYNKPIVKF